MSLTTSLVSYWKLDGNSTDAVAGHNGSDTAIAYSTGNGKINQGAGFNGTSSLINNVGGNTNALALTTSHSVGAWIKFSSTTVNSSVWNSKDWAGSVQTDTSPSGRIRFYIYDGTNVWSILSSGSLSDGIWHYLVAVYDSATPLMTLYVDGSSNATITPGGSPTINSGGVISIGCNNTGQFWTGDIDEVGYWGRVLSSTEVTQLYNAGAGLQYPFGANAHPAFLQRLM